MSRYVLDRVSDADLIRGLDTLAGQDRGTTAEVIAHIAVDVRALYRGAGYESMYTYCVGRLLYSEDAAYKRIQAARVAREYSRLFEDVAAGRLNLSAVCLLAPHLKPENLDELVAAATHRTNAQIREWLAARFAPAAPAAAPAARQLRVAQPQLAAKQVRLEESSAEPGVQTVELPSVEPPQAPQLPREYEMRFTMSQDDHERFRHAQALLSHAIPAGDAAAIYRRAIEVLIGECERRRIAQTARPRAGTRHKPVAGRHVPARVRRAVSQRDGGRCTFVSPSGHRCGARRFLEFDHIVPVARGGASTVENVRLRCRAHNQEAAKQAFGATFMNGKQKAAAAAAAERRTRTPWKEPVASRMTAPRSP